MSELFKPIEIIKPIEDFNGYYISDDGVVYCDLGKGNRDKNKRVERYIINPRKTKNGYCRVYARQTSTNKRKDLYIHRLVAENFIDNPDNKKFVNHKDCRRDNNTINNLEWVTSKENTDQTMRIGHIYRDETGRFVSNFDYEI